MMNRLGGRVALVTGAGSGIGRATAERLAEEGARVVAGVLDAAQGSAVGGHEVALLDVRAERDWAHVIADIETSHGGLDVLVNCAGIHRAGTAETTLAADWDEVMATNLFGTFLGCRHAIPSMRRRGGGAIVNLASIAGIRGIPDSVAYASSKGGVVALTRALAADHVAERIRVNCVCPGATATPMVEQILGRAADPKALRADLAARHPLGRIATPAEIAAVIAFLASDDAAFMTGAVVPVDGGRSGR